MKNNKLDALKFAAFEYLFPDIKKPRRQSRSLQILEGAISVYARYGAESATDVLIATASGVSRPLIFQYFKNREILFDTATKYIRVNFQHYAISFIKNETTIDNMLRAYIISTFRWLDEFPKHARVLLYYLYTCSQKKSMRHINTEFTEAGHKRITALIQLGIEQKIFNCSDPVASAKMIQSLITGGMVSWISEDLPISQELYQQWLIQTCLLIAGYQSPQPKSV